MALQNMRVTLEEDRSSTSCNDSSDDQEDSSVNKLSPSVGFEINGLYLLLSSLSIHRCRASLVPDALMCVLESHLKLMGLFLRRTRALSPFVLPLGLFRVQLVFATIGQEIA